jgi:hypothetical protein
MIGVEDIDASPVLSCGSITAPAEAVDEALESSQTIIRSRTVQHGDYRVLK